jgi:hypothetical protein
MSGRTILQVTSGPASATSANVTGTATLAGNVLAAFASGSYVTKQYDGGAAGCLRSRAKQTLGSRARHRRT